MPFFQLLMFFVFLNMRNGPCQLKHADRTGILYYLIVSQPWPGHHINVSTCEYCILFLPCPSLDTSPISWIQDIQDQKQAGQVASIFSMVSSWMVPPTFPSQGTFYCFLRGNPGHHVLLIGGALRQTLRMSLQMTYTGKGHHLHQELCSMSHTVFIS